MCKIDTTSTHTNHWTNIISLNLTMRGLRRTFSIIKIIIQKECTVLCHTFPSTVHIKMFLDVFWTFSMPKYTVKLTAVSHEWCKRQKMNMKIYLLSACKFKLWSACQDYLGDYAVISTLITQFRSERKKLTDVGESFCEFNLISWVISVEMTVSFQDQDRWVYTVISGRCLKLAITPLVSKFNKVALIWSRLACLHWTSHEILGHHKSMGVNNWILLSWVRGKSIWKGSATNYRICWT